MSSLAAARADNFYYAPDFDPKKHGSLNKYNGQHPLRERAKKLESEGILVIRFEVPFNIWCNKCGEMVGKGVRFNAEKKQVGNYLSTKIWAFSMRHHCGCRITITTDPKNAEYVVTEGATRKAESYTAEDAETVELPDRAEAAEQAADPLGRLERDTVQAAAAAAGREQLTALAEDSYDKHKDEYSLNKQLRARLRAAKKEEAAVDMKRKALGLPDHITLAPGAASDTQAAQLAFFVDDSKFVRNWQGKRRKIMTEPIFDGGAAAALPSNSIVHNALPPTSGIGRSHRGNSSAGTGAAGSRHDRHTVGASSSGHGAVAVRQNARAAAGGAAGRRAQTAKQELQQRVLASAGKKRSLAERAAQQLSSRQRLPPTLVSRGAHG